MEVLDDLHEYYHGVVTCLARGLDDTTFTWESALTGEVQSGSLELERASLIWNFATLEAYQASQCPQDTKNGCNQAAQHFQNAASWLHQIIPGGGFSEFPDLSQTFLEVWQALLVAQSQRCVYESVACAPRPRHLLLAKLAAAAVPLFGDMETRIRRDEESGLEVLQQVAPTLTNHWADFCRAWGMYMSAKAEHHQAILSQSKQQWGQELARLDLAFRFATLCLEYCEQAPVVALQELHTSVDACVEELRNRMEKAEQDNTTTYHQPVPHRQELTEIRGQTLVNIDQPLSKILKPNRKAFFSEGMASHPSSSSSQSPSAPTVAASPPHPMSSHQQRTPYATQSGVGRPTAPHESPTLKHSLPPQSPPQTRSTSSTNNHNIGAFVELFHTEMDRLVFQMAHVAEERSESARKALATVNLPHSLTAYRQEQAGGGIPDDLWERVEALQRSKRITQLKQDLWELRDMAEVARSTFQKMEHQLDLDLESDGLFRQDHPGFEGHDAKEVQKSFRQSLINYDRLLVTAQEGDSVLLRRLEILDTNPKYKLLQFQKSQLDRLLPGSHAERNDDRRVPNSNHPISTIDTSYLSRLLVELSALFHEREVLLNTIKEEVKNYDASSTLQQHAPNRTDLEYQDGLKYAQKSFDGIVHELQTNLEKQTELVDCILAENEQFMVARKGNTSASADSCIVMIEDAMEEIEQLTKHLKEGKDFYDVVIPKLKKLKQQIGDVSARLTVERLEYDDKANRSKQEEEDARMAKNLSNSTGGGGSGDGAHRSLFKPQGQPGFTQVQNDQPHVFVDDEKVATLVAMEFDPAKVVAALMKYNNNVDQALNDLLSC